MRYHIRKARRGEGENARKTAVRRGIEKHSYTLSDYCGLSRVCVIRRKKAYKSKTKCSEEQLGKLSILTDGHTEGQSDM